MRIFQIGVFISAAFFISACGDHKVTSSYNEPGKEGAPAQATVPPQFSAIKGQIFDLKCQECHNATRSAKGVSFEDYLSTTEVVRAGNAEASQLYQVIKRGAMPPAGRGFAAVEESELESIKNWINSGAKNN